MGKIATGNIGIEGLYEWGSGWDSKSAALWNDFWMGESFDHSGNIAVSYTDNSWGRQFYLVGNGVSVYLHPMQTEFVFSSSNSAETENLDMDVSFVTDKLSKLKDYMAAKGKPINWVVEWNVYKEDYSKGLSNIKLVQDFTGKKFRKEG